MASGGPNYMWGRRADIGVLRPKVSRDTWFVARSHATVGSLIARKDV
jgi:hypothetical protein